MGGVGTCARFNLMDNLTAVALGFLASRAFRSFQERRDQDGDQEWRDPLDFTAVPVEPTGNPARDAALRGYYKVVPQ